MLDTIIRGGFVIDGTGAPGTVADVGIRDGRIVAVGAITEDADETIDATGLMVAPGIVDPHTHYDAQLFWDPSASPSNLHGVTTIIAGNCGFTLAPVKPEDRTYISEMMAKVEGMPLVALSDGVPWNWVTFGEYLDALVGRLGVNAGFLVGHCAIRRMVMGADRAEQVATDDEVAQMVAILRASIEAGGLGFSSSQSRTHSDGDGKAITSRYADRREMLAFAAEVEAHEGTTLEYITNGCLDGFSEEEKELMADLSSTANRPLNWNLLTVDSRDPAKTEHQLEVSDRAAARGGKIVALTMPTLVPMNMSFKNHCALFLIPGWGPIMSLPLEWRIEALKSAGVREKLNALAKSEAAGVFRRLSGWGSYVIGDTFADANAGLEWREVAEIAAERGTSPFDTLLDIVVADDLRTVIWPKPTDGDDATWAMRAKAWSDGRAMVGGSDAGAHLDRMCGSNYPTAFLADCLRGRQLVTVEQAVAMMTKQPAELFGLRDRGTIAEGKVADLFVFDPTTVDSAPAKMVDDLPGDSPRLLAKSEGVRRVLVNGVTIVDDGEPTGALPGRVLRSGADTYSVTTR